MTNKGDQVIFGWALGKTEFGLYAVASIWITAAFMLMEQVARRLFYPAFSEVLRERRSEIAETYRKARLGLDAFAVLAAFAAAFLAGPVLDVIYPESFDNVSFYLTLLTPILILFPYRLLYYVILSDGNSKDYTWIAFVTGAATLLVVPFVLKTMGAKAGVIAFACITIFSLPSAFRIAGRIMPIDWKAEARMLALCVLLVAIIWRTPIV